jgi:hypothetical protein
MISITCGIMDSNIPKKYWTDEFKNFIKSMDNIDNDDILDLIREELDNTIINEGRKCQYIS